MEFVKLTCPCCGASLKGDPDELFITCEYCDQTFERKVREKDRNKILRKQNIKQLTNYIACMDALEGLGAETRRARQAYQNSQAAMNGFRNKTAVVSVLIGLIFGSFLMKTGIKYLLTFHPFMALLMFVLCCGVLVGVVLLGRGYYVAGRAGKEEDCAEKGEILQAAEKQEEECRENFDISFLPERYRKKEIACFLLKMLENGRASSMQDAFNLYEDELVKRRNEAYQREQIRLRQEEIDELRRMNSNAQANASNAQRQYEEMQRQYENIQRQYEDMQRQYEDMQQDEQPQEEEKEKSHWGRKAAVIGGIALLGRPITKKILKGFRKGLFH